MVAEIKDLLVFGKLDKEHFLRQAEFIDRKTWSGDEKLFSSHWNKFRTDFNCSHFLGVDPVDLDGDQVNEWVVAASGGGMGRNMQRYIFREYGSKLVMILVDIHNVEFELREASSYGYRDIVLRSNWSGSARDIKYYKFNGNVYVASKCYSEDNMTEIDPVQLTTPRIFPADCDPRNRVIR